MMGFLQDILGQAASMPGDLGGMVGGIGQAMASPQQRQAPQRRPRPTYNQHEDAGFEMLAQLASQGASPEILQMMASDIEGSYGQRLEAWQQKNATRREGVLNRPAYASQAMEMNEMGMDPDAIGAAFQGIPGAGGFIQNQVVPSFGATATGGGLSPESRAQVQGDAIGALDRGWDLTTARKLIMEGVRSDPASTPEEIEEAYNLIGTIYQGKYGGMPESPQMNAPVSMQQQPQGPAPESLRAPGSQLGPLLGGPEASLDEMLAKWQQLATAAPPPASASPLSALATGGKFRA